MLSDPAVLILMYFVLPLWFVVGFADWLCHRASNIQTTTGVKESLIHLLMFIEVGAGLLATMFLQINALIIIFMVVLFFLHEATALWDVSYTTTARTVTPVEQHVHSFLEMIPLMAIVTVITLHWGQLLSIFHQGDQIADYSLSWKSEKLPTNYIIATMLAVVFMEVLPYLEELRRGWRANSGALVPIKARQAKAGATTRR